MAEFLLGRLEVIGEVLKVYFEVIFQILKKMFFSYS
jgi:hypothetical protein